MKLPNWQKFRIILLIFCNFTILVSLFFLLTKSDENIFSYSKTFSEWQVVESSNLPSDHKNLEGRKYQDKSNYNLVIEIYNIPNNHAGNVKIASKYLKFESDPNNLTINKNNNSGYFGLFSANNKMYLTTCIHSEGQLAFTKQQFANLVNSNLKSRLLPWILGLTDLRDWSCLWVNISMSLDNLTEDETALLLQEQLFKLVSRMEFH